MLKGVIQNTDTKMFNIVFQTQTVLEKPIQIQNIYLFKKILK